MSRINRRAAVAAVSVLAIAGSTQAQFVSSITRPLFGEGPVTGFFTDIDAGTNTQLFDFDLLNAGGTIPNSVPGFNGLAGDEGNRRLFGSVRNGLQSDIYTLDYDTLTPSFQYTTTFVRNDNNQIDEIAFDGIAYDTARDTLYGTVRLGSSFSGRSEGLYAIDPNTGFSELVFDYEQVLGTTFSVEISAIDYDPQTDLLYLADEDSDGGRNVYSVDPDNPTGLNFVTEFESGVTDVDGLGAGGGQLFFVTDNADVNNAQHSIYDIASDTFLPRIDSPYPEQSGDFAGSTINPTAGGAYAPSIPAPSAAVLIAGGALIASRRRR
jgi:uncharacterized protein YuzE